MLEGQEVLRFATNRASSAHEGNAGELLATAAFLGELPDKCYIIGVEPKDLDTGMGLSRDVHKSLKAALKKAQHVVDGLIEEFRQPVSA